MNNFQEILTTQLESFNITIQNFNNNDYLIILNDLTQLLKLILELRDNNFLRFKQLIDIFGVDLLGTNSQRFQIIYHLLSVRFNRRLFIKINLHENEEIDSITTIFPCANWYESEVFDMFGINFYGHPNLRRLLCDYDFEGHPLRKDFPLTGHQEVYYDANEQKVQYRKTNLVQDYRNFDFVSPWQGPNTTTDNK